jgi:hypothetical protein
MRAVDGAWNTRRACFSQHCARRCHRHLVCAYPRTLLPPHAEPEAAQFVYVSNQNSDICCFPTFLGEHIEELVLEYAEATESERKDGGEKMVECLHLSLKLRSFTLCSFQAPDLGRSLRSCSFHPQYKTFPSPPLPFASGEVGRLLSACIRIVRRGLRC